MTRLVRTFAAGVCLFLGLALNPPAAGASPLSCQAGASANVTGGWAGAYMIGSCNQAVKLINLAYWAGPIGTVKDAAVTCSGVVSASNDNAVSKSCGTWYWATELGGCLWVVDAVGAVPYNPSDGWPYSPAGEDFECSPLQ